jgi:hypothetical protein
LNAFHTTLENSPRVETPIKNKYIVHKFAGFDDEMKLRQITETQRCKYQV